MDDEILNESGFENELVYSQNVIEFVTVAGEYCGFSESISNFSRKEFIEKSLKLLPLLYLKSTLLPKIESISDVVNEKFVAEHDWVFIKENISQKLGSYDSFIEVSDLMNPTTIDSTSLSISECFADIYQDLRDFISLYQFTDNPFRVPSMRKVYRRHRSVISVSRIYEVQPFIQRVP